MDNLSAVLHQIEQFGIELRRSSSRSGIDDVSKIEAFQEGEKTTFGKGGKSWFKFYRFRPRSGGEFITGSFGTYKGGGAWEKVETPWVQLSAEDRERQRRERAEAQARAAKAREETKRIAALAAVDLWREAAREGRSPYLERKGLQGEACRYLRDGTLVILMIRYDLAREQAIQAAQRILPNGEKYYTRGFEKPGCALRLGDVDEGTQLVLLCEGYATGLTLRMALDRAVPVFVAFDAGNLHHVGPLVRQLLPHARILLCADDDWLTRDPQTKKLNNPGRTAARKVARAVERCEVVYPVFDPKLRQKPDTDFDDLRMRQGLDVCARQLRRAIQQIGVIRG